MDSLGLELDSQTEEFWSAIERIRVDPRAAGDSVVLTFGDKDVNARRGDRAVTARYGQPINLGIVQFTVTAKPSVETATLGVLPLGESAIDGLVNGLGAGRREDTDVIDDLCFRGPAGGPADQRQRTGVPVPRARNGPARSCCRREFWRSKLAETDSTLARAQAELSTFRAGNSSSPVPRASSTARPRPPSCSWTLSGPSWRPTGRPSVAPATAQEHR